MVVKGTAFNWAGICEKLLVLCAISVMASGCAWYQGLGFPHDEREKHLLDNSQLRQDENYRRFYELQQRIDELESKLGKNTSEQAVMPKPAPTFYSLNKRVEDAISYIRQKTEQSIASIDRMLAKVSQPVEKQGMQSPQLVAAVSADHNNDLYTQQGAISGELIRNKEGAVVKSTTTGKRYNYSVVYIYPETQPWLDMWDVLDNEGVQDKWRGKNAAKSTYFIYVGAYYTPTPAERRQRNLLMLTGAEPQIRIREGHQEIAMK